MEVQGCCQCVGVVGSGVTVVGGGVLVRVFDA